MKVELATLHARHATAGAATHAALQDVSLQIEPGGQVAVIGPSGAGKTTLLLAAAAALRPVQGRLLLDGLDPWALRGRELRRLRGRLFLAPQVPPLPPRQRVVTSVLAARLPALGAWHSLRALLKPDDLPAAHTALAAFGLADKLFERVDRLSGGERQRVGLARALLAPASLWLVDEPLSALDPARAQQALATLTGAARQRGVTLLATLHQVDLALRHFPRVAGLRGGTLVFDLPAAQVTREHLAGLYAQHEHELAGAPAVPGAAPVPPPDTLPVTLCR